MIDIKKVMEQVRSKVGDEVVAELNPLLKEIETAVNDLQDTISSVNKESKDRKLKIRDLESKLEDYEGKVTQFDELNNELESLKGYKSERLNEDKKSFQEAFNKVKDHPKFDKVKDLFKSIPEPDKDGVFSFDEIDENVLVHNVEKLRELNRIEYFQADDKRNPDGKTTPGNLSLKDRIESAKSLQELRDINKNL